MGENIIIISISARSRSVAPVKLEINLASPKCWCQQNNHLYASLETMAFFDKILVRQKFISRCDAEKEQKYMVRQVS